MEVTSITLYIAPCLLRPCTDFEAYTLGRYFWRFFVSSVTYTELGKLQEAVEMNLQAVLWLLPVSSVELLFMGRLTKNSASRSDTIKCTNLQGTKPTAESISTRTSSPTAVPTEVGASPWRLMSQELPMPWWSCPATGNRPASGEMWD